jgi:hypothetical protein
MSKPESWGAIQRRWGAAVSDYTVEQTKDLIREIVDVEDDFALFSLLIVLKFRFDCPDLVFELLDEINTLKDRAAPKHEFAAWGERARSSLRRYIGDEPSIPLLRLNFLGRSQA